MNKEKDSKLTVKTGWSGEKNTRKAVRAALEDLKEYRDRFSLVFAYASMRHDLGAVVSDIRETLGQVPLIGCSTTGEICRGGLLSGGMAVAGILSDRLTAAVGYGRSVYRDPVRAGREAASMARQKLGERFETGARNKICLIHAAGFTMDKRGMEEDVLPGIREVLPDDWQIVGGSSGDDCKFLRNWQFADDQVFDDAVALALISTDHRAAHRMEHGFVPTDRTCKVTDVQDNVVRKIDGKLALDFYADLLDLPPSKLTKGLNLVRMTDKLPRSLVSFSQKFGLTPQRIMDNIPFYTLVVDHPFGMRTESGAFVAKVPKIISSEGYLEFHTRIAPGQELTLMKVDRERTLTASARAMAETAQELGTEPSLILVYECVGRYLYMIRDIDALYGKIKTSTGAQILGFFSSAEQGVMQGLACQTHNYSTSVLAFAD
jgi:hypothetical protein